MHIIDRRLNPQGKSLPNRQRFLKRAKAIVKAAVKGASGDRKIEDIGKSGSVAIATDGLSEPSFHRAPEGFREHVLPGNKKYLKGDRIARPRAGGGGGGSGPGEGGGGEDAFQVMLSRDEFLDLFLEDLELPDLDRRKLATTEVMGVRRAGYSPAGSPSSLSVQRTMRNAMSRRIALGRPKIEDVEALERELADREAREDDGTVLAELKDRIATLRSRSERVPYIDPIDIRYRRFEPQARPIAKAVMFCLMDVSGSMTEHMKDLAKRFFMLLYIFLGRRYKHVDVVFIRHTHEAHEVDEDTFFNSRETGGTVVSSALQEMRRIVAERYPASDWNIYAAQASDGDNMDGDTAVTTELLDKVILPACQYFAYLEVADEGGRSYSTADTTLWRTFEATRAGNGNLAMRRVNSRGDIFPVFRDLFKKQGAVA